MSPRENATGDDQLGSTKTCMESAARYGDGATRARGSSSRCYQLLPPWYHPYTSKYDSAAAAAVSCSLGWGVREIEIEWCVIS